MSTRHRSRGMSTAEILVGTTLSLVSLAALFTSFRGQERALATQTTYAETQAVTRSVIDFMLREIRMASYDPTDTALVDAPGPDCPGNEQGIEAATATSIRFRQDLDGDGALTTANEDVTYTLVGDELRRIDPVGGTVVLATGLETSSFRLRYFNASNPPVELVPSGTPASLTSGQRDCVAKVQVTLNALRDNPNPRIQTQLHSLATSQVAIRNRALTNF